MTGLSAFKLEEEVIEEEMLEEWVEALWGRFDTVVLEDESDWPIFIM